MKNQAKILGVILAFIAGCCLVGYLAGSIRGWYIQKPDMPVAVSYRDSKVGNGYVVTIHNTSGKFLAIRAVFCNSTLNQSLEKTISLDPYGMQEYGWMEGWQFVSGETITLMEDNYRTIKRTIP